MNSNIVKKLNTDIGFFIIFLVFTLVFWALVFPVTNREPNTTSQTTTRLSVPKHHFEFTNLENVSCYGWYDSLNNTIMICEGQGPYVK